MGSELTQLRTHGEGLHDPPAHSSGLIFHCLLSSCAKNPSSPCSFKSPCPLPGTPFSQLISSVCPFGTPSRHACGHQVMPSFVTSLLVSLPLPPSHCVAITFFKNLFILFIYFWLHWVFIAACGLSLVAVSRGYSSLRCEGSLRSMGSKCTGFSSCGSRAQ